MPNEIIFEINDTISEMFFLVEGLVEMKRPNTSKSFTSFHPESRNHNN